MCGGGYAQGTVCVEVRGDRGEVGSLPPPYGSWGLNSGHQAWWQPSLPTEPSWWLHLVLGVRVSKVASVSHLSLPLGK